MKTELGKYFHRLKIPRHGNIEGKLNYSFAINELKK